MISESEKAARIIDKEGSFIITSNDVGIVPLLRFCSKNLDNVGFMAKITEIPAQMLDTGQMTLTLYIGALRSLLPKVLPLMKNIHRAEKAGIILETIRMLDSAGSKIEKNMIYTKQLHKFRNARIKEIRNG